MRLWHLIRYLFCEAGLAGLIASAPVSLIGAWILWRRNDRPAWRENWRFRVLFAGILVLTLSFALLICTSAGEWWTESSQLPIHKLVLDDLSTTGAMCCMFAMLASAIGKGRARLAVAAAGFFGLFLYGLVTPFGIAP